MDAQPLRFMVRPPLACSLPLMLLSTLILCLGYQAALTEAPTWIGPTLLHRAPLHRLQSVPVLHPTPQPEAVLPSRQLIRWSNPRALKSCDWEGGGISNQTTQWLPGHGASEACTPGCRRSGIGYVLCSQSEPQLPFLPSSVASPQAPREVGDLSCPSAQLARIPISPEPERYHPTEHKRGVGRHSCLG